MRFLQTPKQKVFAAAAALALLAVGARAHGLDATTGARWILGAAALVGMAIWWRRAKASATAAPAPRLRVLSRTGLSQRCSLALVEADGRNFLVAFGDGFAELLEAPREASPIQGRRPRPARRIRRKEGRA
jgi:flagellar protein FliO/FliZ